MIKRRLVAIPCKLAPGMMSGERYFSIQMANGEIHEGLAPRFFCWNQEGRLVREYEPESEIDGFLAARIVDCEEVPDDQLAVEIPDGKVIAVFRRQVLPRPTEINPHVSV